MHIPRPSLPAVAALAVTALPLPLQMVGGRRHSPATPPPSAGLAAAQPTTAQPTTAQPTTPQPTTAQPTTAQPTTAQPTTAQPTATPSPHSSIRQGRGWSGRAPASAGGGLDLVLHVHPSSAHHTARAAGDPGDTISDFKFSPATITVHVGDTITWTNNGPTAHTATASNGSFDTGVLKKGESGSHTFTQAGTIAYICSIHPFMHGTVVVLASATPAPAKPAGTTGTGSSGSSGSTGTSGSSGSTGTSGSSGSTGTSGSSGSTGTSGSSGSTGTSGSSGTSGTSGTQATTTATGTTLPVTGLDLMATVLSGAVLVGAGIGLRRRFRGSQDHDGSVRAP
jgi:plastocyanin